MRPAPRPTRLPGVDTARAVAVLGMFAAHALPLLVLTSIGGAEPTFAGSVASGRASVLFMVVAGLSLELFDRSLRARGVPVRRRALIYLRRALALAALGLITGLTNEGIANILVHYAMLFLLLPLALFLPPVARWLLTLGWLMAMPMLRLPLSTSLEGLRLDHNPNPTDLLDPARLMADLWVTGYYPLLVWFGFGLLGMALGTLPLRRLGAQLGLLAAGLLGAASSLAAGWWKVAGLGDELQRLVPELSERLPAALVTGRYGAAVENALGGHPVFAWLPMPHSNSLLFTLHAACCALAIIGLCLWLTPRLGWFGRVLSAAGRAPLSLYVGHLLILPILLELLPTTATWWVLVAGLLGTGAWLNYSGAQGPLEALLRWLSGVTRDAPGDATAAERSARD
ncbi:heparan-alpha-glucosaminide N-acetyltransferase domain-containing protein [Glutamicibacter sp. X7]